MYSRDYFYDKQLRRYLLQIIRLFSGFKVYDGKRNGADRYKLVPCTYADMSRLGATYLNKNSENILTSAPMLSLHISDFQPLPEYRHTPHYEGVSHITEKQKNSSGDYINKPASKYTISQLMPVPFTMNVNVDVFTTSTDQKMELMEQILVWYNPGFEFRVNSSPMDMGNVANIQLDNIQWTSRSVPQGTSTEIDVMTLTFRVYPVFITSPAKIRKQTKIHSIYTNMHLTTGDENTLLSNSLDDIFTRENYLLEPVVATPNGYDLEVYKKQDNNYYAKIINTSGGYDNWNTLFDKYGKVDEGVTTIRIGQSNNPEDDNSFIFGTFLYTNSEEEIQLEFDVDTFSTPTLDPVDAIINPNATTIPTPNTETRFLIASDIKDSSRWGGLVASQWDIIETVDGGATWSIAFDASETTSEEYVINLTKDDLYKFHNGQWISAISGRYTEGFWAFDVEKLEGT